MQQLSFPRLQARVQVLYGGGAYREALELVTREAGRFPERFQRISHWRMCLAARAGELEPAMQTFREALDAGQWYPDWWLADTDLDPLRDRPDFVSLSRLCAERQAAAQAVARPELLVLEPPGPHTHPLPLLLALHGNHNRADRSAAHWRPMVEDGWLVTLPQSSQVGGPDVYVWNDPDLATREIQVHLESLGARFDLDHERVVVAGFSMGATMAIFLALSRAIPARGFLAVAPYLPEVENLRPLLEERRAHAVAGYLVVGEDDGPSLDGARTLALMLREHDLRSGLEQHPEVAHEFPPAFEQSLKRGLKLILS